MWIGFPMACFEPKSVYVSEMGGFQAPGNAPGFSSRVVGEKTSFTDSLIGDHPGGGSCFFAAHEATPIC